MSDEMKQKLGTSDSEEWETFQAWVQGEMSEEHEFEVIPILKEAQANKLLINQIRVFDVLGLLVNPKEKQDEEEKE